MTRDEVAQHITARYDAESGNFFAKDSSVIVFMRTDNKKWFAATKNIGRRYLGIGKDGRIDILNVKLQPHVVASLRKREGFLPAWNMNQNNWVTILLDGTVPDEEILAYLDSSFADAGIKGRKR